jgi:hypothetical protein
MSRSLWLCHVSIVTAALWAMPACGGDDDGDDVSVADSGPGGGGADGGGGACPVETAIGPFDPLSASQALHFAQGAPEGQPEDPAVRLLSIAGPVGEGGPPVDLLFIELWDGFGAFDGGQLAAGEYAIEGPEATLAGCGVCVYLFGDAQEVNGEIQVAKQYIATGGTVTVESAGTREGNEITGDYTGSITGLTMAEIDTASMAGGPLAGGCETAIETITWDAPIANGDEPEGP